jgi:hypothetical protein
MKGAHEETAEPVMLSRGDHFFVSSVRTERHVGRIGRALVNSVCGQGSLGDLGQRRDPDVTCSCVIDHGPESFDAGSSARQEGVHRPDHEPAFEALRIKFSAPKLDKL